MTAFLFKCFMNEHWGHFFNPKQSRAVSTNNNIQAPSRHRNLTLQSTLVDEEKIQLGLTFSVISKSHLKLRTISDLYVYGITWILIQRIRVKWLSGAWLNRFCQSF